MLVDERQDAIVVAPAQRLIPSEGVYLAKCAWPDHVEASRGVLDDDPSVYVQQGFHGF
jgi:hypothetical protein